MGPESFLSLSSGARSLFLGARDGERSSGRAVSGSPRPRAQLGSRALQEAAITRTARVARSLTLRATTVSTAQVVRSRAENDDGERSSSRAAAKEKTDRFVVMFEFGSDFGDAYGA